MNKNFTQHPLQPTVLLVDDDDEDRMLMRIALESAELPMPIREFDSGEALLAFLKQETGLSAFESVSWIVILDKYMPGINGFETLRQLKAHPFWQRIPVVLFVNTQNQDEMELCVDLGAMACMNKPLHFEDTKELMRMVYQYWQNNLAVS